jgi:hypothetical protein
VYITANNKRKNKIFYLQVNGSSIAQTGEMRQAYKILDGQNNVKTKCINVAKCVLTDLNVALNLLNPTSYDTLQLV